MGADRIFRRFRDLLDVTFGSPADGDVVQYDAGTNKIVLAPPTGAPSGPAGGDLAGTYPDPVIANGAVTIPQLAFDPATQGELDIEAAARAAADAGLQPLDSDLTAIAALSTSAFGRGLLTLANQAALLAAAGAAAAVHVHAGEDITSGTVADARIASTIARDSEVTSAISALSSVYQPLDSDLTAIAALSTSAYGRSFLTLADAAAARTLIGAAAQTDLAAHIADTSDAHDASAVSYDPTASGLASTDVQDAIDEVAAGGSPTGAAGGVLDGTYPNPGLASGVAGAGLAETADVLSVNVDGATLEINADSLRVKADGITAAQIAADAVGSSEIAANAVGSSELADGAVDTSALQDSSVTSVKIADGTIAIGDLAFDPATQAELDAEAVSRAAGDALAVPKTLYDANTVLAATADDTPAAVTMGASTILARLAAGNIKAASVSEIVALLAAYVLGGTDVAVADGGTGASTAAGARTNLGLVIGTDVQAHDVDLDTYAGITPSANVQSVLAAANYDAIRTLLGLVIGTDVQAHDSDLDIYAGITPSANVQAILGAANYAAIRTLLALVVGTDVEAHDADLTTIAGLAPADDDVLQRKAGAWANRTLAQLISDLAALGTTFQPLDSDLTAFAGLAIATDKLPYGTGSHTLGLADFTAAGRALVDDADASAQRTTLGLGTVATLASDTDTALAANSDTRVATQKAVKAYVDAVAVGLAIKQSCRVATAAALPTNTYLAGVITETGNGALTVDGVAVANADRVLVKDEVAGLKNGIYTVTDKGSAGTPFVLTRSTDMNTAAEIPGAFSFVEDGTVNSGAGFVVASSGPFTIGTTVITWTQFSGAGEITAGTGLGKSGNTLSITDAELLALAGLVSAADKLAYFTGSGTAALADFTAAGRALVDDADAAAQRTTLGLGTLATKSTVATADISAGAVTEAKQTLADNTTGDVSTSAHGYAPKAPNDATKALDGTGAYSVPQVEESDQQAGVMVPTIPGWVGINGSFTAKRANFTRFTLLKNRTISSIKFRSNTAGTGNIDVCIIDSSGNILRSSGSVSGKKGANTWQTVNLTSSLALTAGTVYYVGIMTDTSDGTYDAVFWNVSTGIGLDQMWGSTLGLLQSFFKDITNFPFASQTVTVGTANGAVGPIAGLI